MEVTVRINQAWIKDVQRFLLRCRVQTVGSGEAHEASVFISQPTATREFAFTFASRPSQLSLLFVASSPRHESTPSRQENELGRSAGTLTAAESGLERTRTLLLARQVADTNVGRFAGKVTYVVHLRDIGCADFASLLSDEAKRTCGHVLPAETPFVSVVFHCACVGADPTREPVGVARIGDRNDISVNTLLQESSPQLQHLPILKPVRLFCQEFDCLELHIADSNTGRVDFSSSRALSRLTPFRPTHFNFDAQSVLGGGGQSSNTGAQTSVSISALYTPSTSQFNRFEGFEIAVCEVSLAGHMDQCRDVVMGVQLADTDRKGKTPTPRGNSVHPPFFSPKKKSGASVATGLDHEEYHVSVLKYRGNQLNQGFAVKSYHIFQHSLPQSGGLDLLFHIYGSPGTQVWWNTEYHTLAKLEISEETLPVLQTGELPWLHWSASNKDSSQSCTVTGILRWKSRKTKFLTESSLMAVKPAVVTSPSQTSQHEPSSAAPTQLDKDLPLQQSDHHVLVAPEETSAGDTDIVKHLTEFETSLCQMAGDFRTLRRENEILRADNDQLVEEISTLRSLVGTSGSLTDADLQGLSKSDLTLRVKSLQQSLEAERKTRERFQERNRALQRGISTLQDLEVSYTELQEIHTAQQKLIQTLRGKMAKYHKCSDICRKQESVITQLESLLAKQARGNPSAKDDAISLLGRENAQLRTLLQQTETGGDHSSGHRAALLEKDQTIQSLKSQLSQLVTRCKDLERGRRSDRGGGGGGGPKEKRELEVRVFELEQKLLVAEAKLGAQSTQLQENAEIWMQEKGRYELELAEYRTRLDTLIKSGQQALSATSATTQQELPTIPSGAQEGSEGKGGEQKYFSGKTSKKEFSF